MTTSARFRQIFLLAILLAVSTVLPLYAQDASRLTPLQLEIEKQRARLGSTETEERRDAIAHLGAMRHPSAARAAVAGLKDVSVVVRATAAGALQMLPPEEAVASLLPLLNDKDEFVRREAAYALGRTESRSAVDALLERLTTDKKAEVRGAAAVALGQIQDPSTISPLIAVLTSVPSANSKKKTKGEQDGFVLRSAARALGQIGSSAGTTALIAMLTNEATDNDVRREAALALGAIGDSTALNALMAAERSDDPHLSRAAFEAIQKIKRGNSR